MAVRTSLTWIKKRFAKAIKHLAGYEMWPQAKYEFTGTYNEKTGRFSLVFGTELPTAETSFYPKIKEALRSAFPDYPSIMSNIGLVIQQVDPGRLEEVYQQLMIDEDEIDLGDLLA